MKYFVTSQVKNTIYGIPKVSAMKRSSVRFLILLLAATALTCRAFAQTAEEEEEAFAGGRVFKAIVQTGLSMQWSDPGHRLFNLSVETQRGPYQHYGVVWSQYLLSNAYYEGELRRNSMEMGVFGKFFLHGRLTGRKSKVYFGPELRYGLRKFRISSSSIYPPPNDVDYINFNLRVTKIMLRWGWQYRLDNIMLEFALPFGRESTKTNAGSSGVYNPYYVSEYTTFFILPTIQMGIGF